MAKTSIFLILFFLSAAFSGPLYAQQYLYMQSGKQLNKGEKIEIAGKGKLMLQNDGNFVFSDASNTVRWSSGTAGQPVTRAIMQPDGHLCLYNGSTFLWGTNTTVAGSFLSVRLSDHRICVFREDGSLVRELHGGTNPECLYMEPGRHLDKGEKIEVPGKGRLILQNDGMLAFIDAWNHTRWASTFTQNKPVTHAIMQHDGHLCIYNGNNFVWGSQTTMPGSFFAIHLTNHSAMIIDHNGGLVKELYPSNVLKFNRTDANATAMCNALKIPNTLNAVQGVPNLADFKKAIGTLGMDAAEAYFANVPMMTQEQALNKIGSVDSIRQKVVGVLAVKVKEKLVAGGTDAATVALRTWGTQLFRAMKVGVAKGTLDEYKIWKKDPCSYVADGYVKPSRCNVNNPYINMWDTEMPPSDHLAKAGLNIAIGATNDMVIGISAALTGVSIVGALTATASGLGITAATSFAGEVVTLTSLYSAFGGSLGSSAGGTFTAASIGATSWAGVVAGPVAIVAFAATIGVSQGLAVFEAAMVEPNLKRQLGVAMTEGIVIGNALGDEHAANLFFLAFVKSALKSGWYAGNDQIDGEVTFSCEAGYVSKFTLSYKYSGFTVNKATANLSVGEAESLSVPAGASDIVAKGYMISAGEHLVFEKAIPAPTYTCFKTYNTIFNPSWANAWPLAAKNEVQFFHQGGYVAKFYIEYSLGGQPQNIATGEKTAGWKETYTIPENATNVRVWSENATGLAWEPWRKVFDKTYPTTPNICFKIWGTTLDAKWANECN